MNEETARVASEDPLQLAKAAIEDATNLEDLARILRYFAAGVRAGGIDIGAEKDNVNEKVRTCWARMFKQWCRHD